jgi:hypothetical protein
VLGEGARSSTASTTSGQALGSRGLPVTVPNQYGMNLDHSV